MKTLKLIVPLVLLSAISANAFPDTLEKLFVENDFTTTQKKTQQQDLQQERVLQDLKSKPRHYYLMDRRTQQQDLQSNYVAEYGDVISEIEVYGYKNVLVTYFPEGTYGSEYDYAAFLSYLFLNNLIRTLY
jgi:hypothetical protein